MTLKHFTQLIAPATVFVRRVFATCLAATVVSTVSFAAQPTSADVSAKPMAQPVGYGSHGMAVFGGRDGLYASHLPMFHAPHDAQVLLRFHLADAATDARLRAQLAQKPELWTLDPESFDLHRLQTGHADPLKQFGARFVQGHFERGGKERFAGQTVVVDEVLLFKRLELPAAVSSAPARSAGRYLLLGTGREYFAVKEIDRRPDFDAIVAMLPLAAADAAAPAVKQFTVATVDLKAPTRRALQAAVKAQVGGPLQVGKTLYFETEDLK
ncbi:MAG: hypothetical protein V4858_15870 [Pseudomonadota bacterium]